MNIFIISGAPNTGKTQRIHYVCDWLIHQGYCTILNHSFIPTVSYGWNTKIDDFTCLLEKNGRKVLLHSATDDNNCIDTLKSHIVANNPDVVITSCRDYNDWPRDYLCKTLGLTNGLVITATPTITVEEFPLARITRRGCRFSDAYDWFFHTTTNQITKMLMVDPYML